MYYRWTKTAIECYKIGANCSKCKEVPEDLKTKCRMKKVILFLVRKYGKPKEVNNDKTN